MKFMNLNKYGARKFPRGFVAGNMLTIEGDDNDDDGGGDKLTDAEVAEFNQWKTDKQKNADDEAARILAEKNGKKSAYETLLAEQAEQKLKDDNKNKNTETIREEVKFDGEFDALIESNKKAFKNDAEFFRKGAKGLSGSESIHFMKCMAVKDFFSSPENLDLLTARDKAFIGSSVIDEHERNIDSGKAWEVFESALNVSRRLQSASQYRKSNTDENGNSNTPLLDKFINKSKNRIRGIKEA
jgi:hypothetical protein